MTGIVQTNRTYGRFGDGYFMLHVAAFNSERPGAANQRAIVGDTAKVKIYVLQVVMPGIRFCVVQLTSFRREYVLAAFYRTRT